VLQPGPAAGCTGCAYLHLWMHLLCGLRGYRPRGPVSELRRQSCAKTHQAACHAASAPRLDPARGECGRMPEGGL